MNSTPALYYFANYFSINQSSFCATSIEISKYPTKTKPKFQLDRETRISINLKPPLWFYFSGKHKMYVCKIKILNSMCINLDTLYIMY